MDLGYFLDYKNPKFDLEKFDKLNKKYYSESESDLIKIGRNLWLEAVQQNFEANETPVVPLSGGLDSRAIIAALLEFTESKNIQTYTYGIPGSLDFDIGNHIANKLNLKHTQFDLSKIPYRQEELEDISRRVDFQTVLFHHGPVWEIDKYYKGCNIWTGFMGETLAGSKLLEKPSENLKDGLAWFVKKNKFTKSIELTNSDDYLELIVFEENSNCNISIDEQLDFLNRQSKFIYPHVMMNGYEYKAPFLNEYFLNYLLNVRNIYRLKQNIYKKMLLNSFPNIFSLRTKSNYGLGLNAKAANVLSKKVFYKIERSIFSSFKWYNDPFLNYINFNNSIRKRSDLNKIIYSNIMDLKSRKIIDWIDIDSIWDAQINYNANHADALLVLTSLEIHLKAGKKL